MIVTQSRAQSKSDKINESIQNTAKALKDIFHHKKNTSQAPGTTQTSNSTSVKTGSGLILTPKPGQLAKNAKSLDVDQIEPFNGGAAVVLKGSSSAMIDSAGDIVVPFNKYQFMFHDETGALSDGVRVKPGIFQFIDQGTGTGSGFLDAKGNIVAKNGDNHLFDYNNNKTMLVASQKE